MEGGTMDLGSSTPAPGRRDRSASSWPPGTATPPPPPPAMAPSSPPNGKEFLMQKNTLKRPRSPDGDHTLALGNFEGSANEAAKILDVMDTRPSLDNSNRKKKGRGRGCAGTGRGRGSKTGDPARLTSTSSTVATNGQLDKLTMVANISDVFWILEKPTEVHD